jgi:hypothetical protein
VRRIARRTFKASCKQLAALSKAFLAVEKETPLRGFDGLRKSLREAPFDQVRALLCSLDYCSKVVSRLSWELGGSGLWGAGGSKEC